MDPLSGFRFLRNISSCCCPAHNPLTHSLLSLITLKLMCLLFSMIILYSSAPSSTTWRSAKSEGAPDRTACRQAGSPLQKKRSFKLNFNLLIMASFLHSITFVRNNKRLFVTRDGLIEDAGVIILVRGHKVVLVKLHRHPHSRRHHLPK